MAKKDNLFIEADEIKSEKIADMSFFDKKILSEAVKKLLSGDRLDLNAFWNMAKIGTQNASENHKRYYVSRAVKFEAIEQEKKIKPSVSGFNAPANTAFINQHINKEAVKIANVILKDNSEATILKLDKANLFK